MPFDRRNSHSPRFYPSPSEVFPRGYAVTVNILFPNEVSYGRSDPELRIDWNGRCPSSPNGACVGHEMCSNKIATNLCVAVAGLFGIGVLRCSCRRDARIRFIRYRATRPGNLICGNCRVADEKRSGSKQASDGDRSGERCWRVKKSRRRRQSTLYLSSCLQSQLRQNYRVMMLLKSKTVLSRGGGGL